MNWKSGTSALLLLRAIRGLAVYAPAATRALRANGKNPQPTAVPFAFDLHPLAIVEPGDVIRSGPRVQLRQHHPHNLAAFQRWYADSEIAYLLRHDLKPLDKVQSQRYFESIILPLSARGYCYAIHETATGVLIGTTALTDVERGSRSSALFRIVIGEKDRWSMGYGTEATRLVVAQAFESLGLNAVKLEVFQHNERAIASYKRVGFVKVDEHTEWVAARQFELVVEEMIIECGMIELPLDFARLAKQDLEARVSTSKESAFPQRAFVDVKRQAG